MFLLRRLIKYCVNSTGEKYLLNVDFMFSENQDGFDFVKLTSLVEESNCWKYFLPNHGISLWCVYRKRSKAICEYVRQESHKRMLPSEIKLWIQMLLSVKLNLAGEWIFFWMCKLCRFMQILYILTFSHNSFISLLAVRIMFIPQKLMTVWPVKWCGSLKLVWHIFTCVKVLLTDG